MLAFPSRVHSAILARYPSEKQASLPQGVCPPITVRGHLVYVGRVAIGDCEGGLMDARSMAEFYRTHPVHAVAAAEAERDREGGKL